MHSTMLPCNHVPSRSSAAAVGQCTTSVLYARRLTFLIKVVIHNTCPRFFCQMSSCSIWSNSTEAYNLVYAAPSQDGRLTSAAACCCETHLLRHYYFPSWKVAMRVCPLHLRVFLHTYGSHVSTQHSHSGVPHSLASEQPHPPRNEWEICRHRFASPMTCQSSQMMPTPS